ncbi:MAG: phosphoribosylglycinamide formyltransferase [Candidatus Planktophila sp.]
MRKIAILASGSGTLAQAIFDAVASGKLQCSIKALICDQPRAAVISRAHSHKIPVHLHPMQEDRKKWNRELFDLLTTLNLDLVVSAGFMRILDPSITSSFPIINSHPALLPAFPGAHAVRDTLAAGATRSGTTIHWIDAGVDTGQIIAQESLDILPGESEESLHERIKILERSLIVATIGQLLATMENDRS